MSQTSSAESSVTEYVMNKKLGAIAMLLSATGMGLVGTISRGTTAGLEPADKSVIGSFLAFGRMTVGLLGFIFILVLTRKIGLFRRTRLSATVILGGVAIGLSLGCYISSTLMTTISNAVFLIYIRTPVLRTARTHFPQREDQRALRSSSCLLCS